MILCIPLHIFKHDISLLAGNIINSWSLNKTIDRGI
jgi:hypothetical protein